MTDDSETSRHRRRRSGLWRLLPFAGLLLLLSGIHAYATEAPGAGQDGGRMIVIALGLAAFFSIYGPEGQARFDTDASLRKPKAARSTRIGLLAACLFALAGGALFASGLPNGLRPPANGVDWLLAGCAVVAVGLYARSIHALRSGRRSREIGTSDGIQPGPDER